MSIILVIASEKVCTRREQKKTEAQDMASTLLDAEVRLGELFTAIEKTRGNQYLQASTDGRQRTKYSTIRSLGFTDPEKTAHRFETLAAHKDIVEQVKAEARENDDILTRKTKKFPFKYCVEKKKVA